MAYKNTQNQCVGRDGFLSSLKTFVDDSDDWHVVLDRSVVSGGIEFTVDVGLNTLNFASPHGFYENERVNISSTGTIPGGLSQTRVYFVEVVDANTIKLYDNLENRYNDSIRTISSVGAGTHTISVDGAYLLIADRDTSTPITLNDGTHIISVGYSQLILGTIYLMGILGFDSDAGKIAGTYGGKNILTADSTSFVYDFRCNSDYIATSARLNGNWTYAFTDKLVHVPPFGEDTAVTAESATAITAGENIVITLTDAVDAARFSVDKFYYLYDFRNGVLLDHVKVTKVGAADGLLGTQVEIDRAYDSYDAGAVLCSYNHRYYLTGNNSTSGKDVEGASYYNSNMSVPYCSSNAPERKYRIHRQSGTVATQMSLGYDRNTLQYCTLQDSGERVYEIPRVIEYSGPYNTIGMGNIVGQVKSFVLMDKTGMVEMESGVMINNTQYDLFGPNASRFAHDVSSIVGLFLKSSD